MRVPPLIRGWTIGSIPATSNRHRPLDVPLPNLTKKTEMQGSILTSVLVALLMSVGGYAKRSLSLSGAVAAFFIGLVTFLASVRCGVLLIAFFVSSSVVTRVGKWRKREIEGEAFVHGGGRTMVQAVSNAPATVLCVAMLLRGGGEAPRLVRAYLAQLAAMQGDTWSSELGVLGLGQPLLITTLRRVPAGTNGAVSLLGFAGALGGGAIMGTALAAADWFISGTASLATVGTAISFALLGSVVDSVLGATLQYSGFDGKRVVEHPGPSVRHICGRELLDNHQINLLASLIMMGAGLLL